MSTLPKEVTDELTSISITLASETVARPIISYYEIEQLIKPLVELAFQKGKENISDTIRNHYSI